MSLCIKTFLQRPQVASKKSSDPVNKPTSLDIEWAEKNPWFNRDSVMTGFALGVHEDLVKSGTNPLRRLKSIISS